MGGEIGKRGIRDVRRNRKKRNKRWEEKGVKKECRRRKRGKI